MHYILPRLNYTFHARFQQTMQLIDYRSKRVFVTDESHACIEYIFKDAQNYVIYN